MQFVKSEITKFPVCCLARGNGFVRQLYTLHLMTVFLQLSSSLSGVLEMHWSFTQAGQENEGQ